MKRLINKTFETEAGATLLEYSLIASLIGIVAMAAVSHSGATSAGAYAISTCAIACSDGGGTVGNLHDASNCPVKFKELKAGLSKCKGKSGDDADLCAAEQLLVRVAAWCN